MEILIRSIIILFLAAGLGSAQEPETFDEAKSKSIQTGKPVLIEFVRDGCEYCAKAEQAARSEPAIIEALTKVVHVTLNVSMDEGYKLSKEYKVGYSYPVFILTDNKGETINRWTGYYGVQHFTTTFQGAISDLTTITEREKRCAQKPIYNDAAFLAKHFSENGEYLMAIKYYRLAENLAPGRKIDFSYKIFSNSTNACWNNLLAFDEVLKSADVVLSAGKKEDIINVAKTMGNLARKIDKTDKIEKYIIAGLRVSSGKQDKKTKDSYILLFAEKELYISNNPDGAIAIMKKSLGKGWETDPQRFFKYASWCQKRNLNLTEAEKYTRQAAARINSGPFKGKVLNTLAEICHARGNTAEAVELMKQAIDENPISEFYQDQLDRFREALKNQ